MSTDRLGDGARRHALFAIACSGPVGAFSSAMAGALRRRGVGEPAASLTAEAGIAVFKIGFERWLDDEKSRTFSLHIRAALDELRAVSRTAAVARLRLRARRDRDRAGTGGRTSDVRRWHSGETENARDIPARGHSDSGLSLGITRLY